MAEGGGRDRGPGIIDAGGEGINPEDYIPEAYFSNMSDYEYFYEAYRGL